MKMLKNPPARQQGFTLVELIVVIVILGILAATALPKFVDVSGDARKGVLQGVEGAMRGANMMLYGKAAALGLANTDAGATNKVTLNGQDVLLKYGYAKDLQNLSYVLDLNPPGDFKYSADGATPGALGATSEYIHHNGSGTAKAATCRIKYTAPTGAGVLPDYATGSVLTDC